MFIIIDNIKFTISYKYIHKYDAIKFIDVKTKPSRHCV